jgi:hypothetical protein
MWPELNVINPKIYKKIINRRTISASKLDCWIRIISGAVTEKGSGLIMETNQNATIFRTGGKMSIYGDAQSSGDIGTTLDLKAVGTGAGRALRPSPVVTSFEVKEGIDQISREANLTLKCFTLAHMELLQSYLMEPGYSLCIEYGWNTPLAGVQALNMKVGTNTIINAASDYNLDHDKLMSKRIASLGDYDSFLGFIVGGNVKSVGDAFEIEVRLKGSPSLPTFLQSQHKILKLASDQSTLPVEGPFTYDPSEIEDDSDTTGAIIRDRRFKNMYNSLPSFRQTKKVRETIKDTTTMYDYINFDAVTNKSISSYTDPYSWQNILALVTPGGDGGGDADVNGASIEKEKLFSKHKYLRFEVAMNILNENDSFQAYKVGNKEVSIQISISDVKIGAFPKMFSMKASKLIIPGELPDFAVYFLNTEDVIQNKDGKLNELSPINNTLNKGTNSEISFVQNYSLNHKQHKFTEDAGNWGLLKNLYLNFDVFLEKIQQKNKNIKEVLQDILNEMSSAVNSFWNFQIHEKSVDDANGGKRYVLSVYDENWIGKPDTIKFPALFHSGEKSVFLESNLDLSVSAEMTNQIINKRLAFAVNPDQASLSVGGFFNSQTDLFLKAVTDINGNQKAGKTEEEIKKEEEKEPKKSTKVDDLKAAYKAKQAEFNEHERIYKEKDTFFNSKVTDDDKKKFAKLYSESEAAKAAYIAEAEKQGVSVDFLLSYNTNQEIKAEKTSKLTYNLNKIDVVPNPKMARLGTVKTEEIKTKQQFDSLFQVYCFDDAAYFDRLKNDAFSAKFGLGSLSHPLPIKYSFTILGCSGLTRGDIFVVYGIPTKYSEHGVFQITEVEHIMNNMTWKTNIQALYRQIN